MCLPEDLGGMREELCRALGLFGGGGNLGGRPLQGYGDKGTDEGQLALLEFGGELTGVGGHKSPIA